MPELSETAFKAAGSDTLLSCRVQPGASKNGVLGDYGGGVKIALQAPPVDGKANQMLCRMLAALCGIPKGCVELKSGLTSRNKVVRITGISPARLREILSKDQEGK